MSPPVSEPVTLDNCEREPIHIPGAIQPHGVLFACGGEALEVRQVSANVESFLGVGVEAVLRGSMLDLGDEASSSRLRERVGRSAAALRESNPFRWVSRDGRAFDAIAHRRSDAALIVELEPSPGDEGTVGGFDPRLRESAMRLQGARDPATLSAIAAAEVRRLTGFDRVMVYRFDKDWHGHVVAEDKREELEPFLGLHYPASDIPAQARRLYTENPIRLIADVAYRPSPLVPVFDPSTNAPLDLSSASLRSVSPIHIEYLTNMGVTASMSISLVIDGVLAGLVACHHYAGPHRIPVRARDTAEFIAYQLSWQLRVTEEAARAERIADGQKHEAEVVRSIAVASELLDGLDTAALLALTDASGAAIVLEEGVRRIGATPSEASIRKIVEALRSAEEPFFTDHLAAVLPEASAWSETAAGLLAVAIAKEIGEYILWFRPAVERIVNWAGDPAKQVTATEAGAPRLSPRGSFALWKETVRGRSLPWNEWEVEAASRLRRAILGGVRRRAVQLRGINQRLMDADRAKDDFLALVSHELRTPLNAITGWAALMKRGLEPARLDHAIEVISRNARAQAQLVDDLLDVSRITTGKLSLEVGIVELAPIVESAIEASALAMHAKGIALTRDIEVDSPPVRGDAERLRQIVVNLLANAVKFTPKGGTVKVSLRKTSSDIALSVTDTGKGIDPAFLPHVFEAFRQADAGMNRRSQGIGLGLAIARHLVELHGGFISAESEGEGRGATFVVRLPIAAVHSPVRSADARPAIAQTLSGLRILAIEDEADSRDLICELLELSGAVVTAAEDASRAFELLREHRFDLIVSDIGMPGLDGLAMMRQHRQSAGDVRIPAIALTAFARAADRAAILEAGFDAHVPKPIHSSELVAAIAELIAKTGRQAG